MNELQIFKHEAFGEVRVAGTNEEPLFCLADVCSILDLTPKVVNQRLSDEVISNYPIIDSLGRTQQALFVNEVVIRRCGFNPTHRLLYILLKDVISNYDHWN